MVDSLVEDGFIPRKVLSIRESYNCLYQGVLAVVPRAVLDTPSGALDTPGLVWGRTPAASWRARSFVAAQRDFFRVDGGVRLCHGKVKRWWTVWWRTASFRARYYP